jgi:phosphonate dehydrogenase
MPPKIVVPNWIEPETIARLQAVGDVVANTEREPIARDALRESCRDAVAVMAFMTEWIDDDFLAACPDLKIVVGALKGFDNLDVDACTRRGVLVTYVPDLLTEPTAELALGLMIALARNMRAGDSYVRSGEFAGWRPRFYGGSLQGATVGVIGAGAVGRETMRLLSGFRGTRLYFDQERLDPTTEKALATQYAPLDALVSTSDFVVLALPLTPRTLHIVNGDFLTRMKHGAYLVNPARGSLVDEAAVAAALAKGDLAGYAADTFEMEDWHRPDRPRHIHPDILNDDRTVLSPHIGSAVIDVRREIAASAADCIITTLNGGCPEHALNPEVLVR